MHLAHGRFGEKVEWLRRQILLTSYRESNITERPEKVSVGGMTAELKHVRLLLGFECSWRMAEWLWRNPRLPAVGPCNE